MKEKQIYIEEKTDDLPKADILLNPCDGRADSLVIASCFRCGQSMSTIKIVKGGESKFTAFCGNCQSGR